MQERAYVATISSLNAEDRKLAKVNDEDLYILALEYMDKPNSDVKRVHGLLVEAADKGDDRAKYAIATWYLNGMKDIVACDKEKALSILENLEESNIPEALFDLAVFYDNGILVEEDEYRAFSLYFRAALLGSQRCCDQISQFYRAGSIVDPDDKLAAAWAARGSVSERFISPPYRVWLRPLEQSQETGIESDASR